MDDKRVVEKRVAVGPTGQTVAQRVQQLRRTQNLTYAELGRRLDAIGRPMPVLALKRIESLERRVDADDLVALAAVFGVSPIALLSPRVKDLDEEIDVTGFDRPTYRGFRRWLEAKDTVEESDIETSTLFRLRSGQSFGTAMTREEFDKFWAKGNDDVDN